MNFNRELKIIEQNIGEAPRRFSILEKLFTIKCSKPIWNWRDDDLSKTIENWDSVFVNGKLAWGHIIQVNSQMFSEGKVNLPGEMLVGQANTPAESLSGICSKLFDLKGNSEELDDAEERAFAAHLEDELTRVYGLQVPKRFSEGKDCFASVVYLMRKHLPDGFVQNNLFPVLYSPIDPKVVVVVPHKYWSEGFKSWWRNE